MSFSQCLSLISVALLVTLAACGDAPNEDTGATSQEIADERNEGYVNPASDGEIIGCDGSTSATVVHVCNLQEGSQLRPCAWGVYSSEAACSCLTPGTLEQTRAIHCE